MSKSRISMLLATAAVAVASFGSASAARAGVSAPQKHPESSHVLKHPEGRLQKHPEGFRVPQLRCGYCNLNGTGSHE